ncbi:MAG: protein-L-isoaspartate(D-aspartate) O-methyltransferase [Victivallales bacterium]|nr:protein-L-isoaspartate(D-aspartate) O-methyltransferase [Victivallales bacterium]
MLQSQIESRGISSPTVLAAMLKVPRHHLLPASCAAIAYSDFALPIGHGQTISQPYIVALMTELLQPKPEDRILEIGTGSGYQAAILAEIVREVYSIEIIKELAEEAQDKLGKTYSNIHFRCANGADGWKEQAPFDGIIITAATRNIPEALIEQLKVGGKMVLPIGGVDEVQTLSVLEKTEKGTKITPNIAVRFVPMVDSSQIA